jgi:DNA-binding NarL/FixJ family response regulator
VSSAMYVRLTFRTRLACVNVTTQQRRVLTLLAEGSSTKQIAGCLGLSERTAQWHVSRLLTLFQVPTRAALIHEAIRQQELPAPEASEQPRQDAGTQARNN